MRRRDTGDLIALASLTLLLGGCSSFDAPKRPRPQVDLSPLGCGYKWFQSGYSPTLEMDCAKDRRALVNAQMALAAEHAREVARTRCPEACPPVDLVDPGDPGDAFPDGVCNSDFVYFTTRLFFQCGSR